MSGDIATAIPTRQAMVEPPRAGRATRLGLAAPRRVNRGYGITGFPSAPPFASVNYLWTE
jgi:hypothetical protein